MTIRPAPYRPKDIHTPRTQAEAGLQHHAWDGRLEPERPWLTLLGYALGGLGFWVGLILIAWSGL